MIKIYLAGATGQLGEYLKFKIKKKKNYKLFDTKIDLSKKKSFLFLKKLNPDVIINCAGLSSVEDCELNYKKALRLNYSIPKNLNNFCIKENKYLIHFSTDHLYDSFNNTENDVKLLNNYAKSKFRGEKTVDISKFLVLRINFFGHYKKKKGLLNWIYKSNKSKKIINLYNNIFFSPLYIKTVFEILLKIIKLRKAGIYNFGSNNGISKSEFAKFVIKLKKFKINYKEVRYENKKNLIKRPKNMIMNVKKFEKTFKLKLPNIKKEIYKINEKL
jgi:dTDP-4-dehydrorhamnose reductase